MSSASREKARDRAALSQYLSVAREFGHWGNVPQYERDVVRLATGVNEPTEAAIIEHVIEVVKPSIAASTRARSPRVKSATSKLKSMIRRPINGAHSAARAAAAADRSLLVRALQEMRLRIPPFRRQTQVHGSDMTDEVMQRECFSDVFRLIDEFGEGCVTLDQIEAFGKRVGPVSSRLLSAASFEPLLPQQALNASGGTKGPLAVSRELFLQALFPEWAAAERARAATQRSVRAVAAVAALNSSQSAPSANEWKKDWHPDDIEAFLRIVKLCGDDTGEYVLLERVKAVCKLDVAGEGTAGSYTVEQFFAGADADRDGRLTIPEAARLFKPSFDASRRHEETEQILYFKNVHAPW